MRIKNAIPLAVFMFVLRLCFGTGALAAARAQANDAMNSDRWVVRVPERYSGQALVHPRAAAFPNGVRQTHCATLQDFLRNPQQFDYGRRISNYASDVVTSKRVGQVEGFTVFDVIHSFGRDDQRQPGFYIKLILVKRTDSEFCEIFDDVSNGVSFAASSYLTPSGSETVLVSEDPVNGNCGCYSSGYWTFDENGPIFLDVDHVIDEVVKETVPADFGRWHGEGFSIQDLTYSYIFVRPPPDAANGTLQLSFAIRNHRLVVIKRSFDPGEEVQ